MITCTQSTRHLKPYLDGELSASAAKALEAHLARCEDCRVELGELRRIQRALRAALAAGVPPPRPVEAILASSHRGRRQEAEVIRSLQRVLLAAAACLVLSAAGLAWTSRSSAEATGPEDSLAIVLLDPSWKESP